MTGDTRRTFSTRIDVPAEAREALVALLNARLADAFDLNSQLKQAHWNVKGSDFIQLHELDDAVAADVLEHVDLIARARNGPRRARTRYRAACRVRLVAGRGSTRCSRRPGHDHGDRRPPCSLRPCGPRRDRYDIRAG